MALPQAEQRQRGENIWEEALARTKAAGEQAMHQRWAWLRVPKTIFKFAFFGDENSEVVCV